MIIDGHGHYTTAPKALAVANHKQKVYIDLSGWSPKYFPNILIQYFNTLLKKKLLFGSDWPIISQTAGWRTSRISRSRTRCGRRLAYVLRA